MTAVMKNRHFILFTWADSFDIGFESYDWGKWGVGGQFDSSEETDEFDIKLRVLLILFKYLDKEIWYKAY